MTDSGVFQGRKRVLTDRYGVLPAAQRKHGKVLCSEVRCAASSSADHLSSGTVLAASTTPLSTGMYEGNPTTRRDGLRQVAGVMEAAANVLAPLGVMTPAFQMLAGHLRVAAAGLRAESGLLVA